MPFRIPGSVIAIAFVAGVAAGPAALAQNQYPPFEAVDADGSGEISLAELQATYPTVEESLFVTGDVDGSGGISPDEYATLTGATQ